MANATNGTSVAAVDNHTTILDNGAYTAKIGTASMAEPKIIPNCIMKAKSERRRPFIGDQIDECRDASGLFYMLAFQRGYLTNWDVQKTLWDHMFGADGLATNFGQPLIITEPQFNFPSVQEAMTEIFFEEYECERLLRTTAADLCAYNAFRTRPSPVAPALQCCLLVDMGYSFTHIVPFVQGRRLRSAVRRIDVGGKLLTNQLKELISYRQLNVMDESYVVNQCKEDVCFVADDVMQAMRDARAKRGSVVCEYVLPDFTNVRRGYIRTAESPARDAEQQTLRLGNERFAVPELLLRPSDVGIAQMGVCEAIMHVVLEDCPPESGAHLLANVWLVGGCACFAGMQARVQRELRSLAPDEWEVRVRVPERPVTFAWEGGVLLSGSDGFEELCMTREEYEEEGARGSLDRFDV